MVILLEKLYNTFFELGRATHKRSFTLDDVVRTIQKWVTKEIPAFSEHELNFLEEGKLEIDRAEYNIEKLNIPQHNGKKYFGMRLVYPLETRSYYKKISVVVREGQELSQMLISLIVRHGIFENTYVERQLRLAVPSVLPTLIEQFEAHDSVFRVTNHSKTWKEDKADKVVELITKNKFRILPIVYVSQGPNGLSVRPFHLSNALCGLAHVYVEPNDRFCQEFNRTMDEKHLCYDGDVTIYWPIAPDGQMKSTCFTAEELERQKRWQKYDPGKPEIDIIMKVLDFCNLRIIPTDLTFNGVQASKDMSDKQFFHSMATSYSEDVEIKKQQYEEQISELKKELSTSRQKAQSLEQLLSCKISEQGLQEPIELASLFDAVQYVSKTYDDRIIVPKSIFGQAKKSSFKDVVEAYKVLQWLATEFYESCTTGSEKNLNQLEISCRESSGFELCMHENDVTARNHKFKQDYQICHDGETIRLEKHVKKGISKDPNHTLRILFEYVPKWGKIIIGYLGLHPKNRYS